MEEFINYLEWEPLQEKEIIDIEEPSILDEYWMTIIMKFLDGMDIN